MADATTSGDMSPRLRKVAERAQRNPTQRILALAHLIDIDALARAFGRQRKNAAAGVDGVTKEKYGQELEARLTDLHQRLVSKRYRHQPIRRVHIPKENGKTRPIGVSAFEDKLVQDAVREVADCRRRRAARDLPREDRRVARAARPGAVNDRIYQELQLELDRANADPRAG